jgi:hypothetical protein
MTEQQVIEKQKLDWPDNVSFNNETNWEPTIIQNQLIAFVSFHYDESAVNPCEDFDGFGDIRSLSTKHVNNISIEEIEQLIEHTTDGKEQVIPLSYFEHGQCKWGVKGTMSSMPDFNWDGVNFAGVWIPDDECIKSVDIWEKEAKEKGDPINRNQKFKEMAEQACETYTSYCNGEVYGYQIELYRLQFSEDDPVSLLEYDDYNPNDMLWEDSCWGFYGNDIDYMKENIENNLQAHLKTMKLKSQFDPEGEPDFNKMSQEDFDRILEQVVIRNLNELMQIPGAYEVFSEHYNNHVLEEWEKEQLK